jgi:cytochrome b involved in lipid metabolism
MSVATVGTVSYEHKYHAGDTQFFKQKLSPFSGLFQQH